MATQRRQIADQILKLISDSPGLTGRQIANRLGLEKSLINSILYSELRRVLWQNKSYKWWPHTQMEKETLKVNSARQNKVSMLCHYYMDCLTRDCDTDICVFAVNKYAPQYIELHSLPLVEDELNSQPSDNSESLNFIRRLKTDRGRLIPYLGYPVRVRYHEGANWSGYFLDPVFVFSLEQVSTNLDIGGETPFINFSVLKRLGIGGGSTTLEESVALAQELGLADSDQTPEIDELFLRLYHLRPQWDWQEEINPFHLSTDNLLSEITKTGIYNRAIVFGGERSPYTRGLETELAKLQSVTDNQLGNTALNNWVEKDFGKNKLDQIDALMEPLPLNTEQRQAVIQGLNNKLTVITGPPGTGKSQVVTSLILNAAWQGKKVLFASKNNKAVDVVEQRANSFSSNPVLLRLGKSKYLGELSNHLQSLLSVKTTTEDEANYQYYYDIHNQILTNLKQLEKQTANLLSLRNEIDSLDKDLDGIRLIFPNVSLWDLQKFDIAECQKYSALLKTAINAATREKQGLLTRIFWGSISRKRHESLQNLGQSMDHLLCLLNLQSPSHIDDSKIHEWHRLYEQMNNRIAALHKISEYLDKLSRLCEVTPLEQYSHRMVSLQASLANNSAKLWEHWIRLQPGRLTQQDMDNLSEFCSLLQMIVAANENNERLGGQVFRNYYRLFPKVADQLPCWAVTSLSISSKVPFEPCFFDLVVIDEASQCDIASALPLLYRAKQAVIIGDPMQLRHISQLTRQQDINLLSKHELAEGFAKWAYGSNSIFDLARSLCSGNDIVNLKDHHRSHKDIIEFSNQNFYRSSLRIATKYDRLKSIKGYESVRWINCCGHVHRPAGGGAVNEIEATAVVQELKRLLLEQNYQGTVGVVTPFRAQANRINDMVTSDRMLLSVLGVKEFLVDTAHGFQGDERDLIIFSPVVSENIPDTALGFLRNNPHLFNVAITRARACLIIIGDAVKARVSNVDYLAKFANYVSSVHDSGPTVSSSDFVATPDYPVVSNPEQVSDWERFFYKKMYNAGIIAIPQYQEDQYRLDFALLRNNKKLNIEIDGEMYHRNWDGELCRRDQLRNQRLIELGWDIMRFWVYQIRDNTDWCINRIQKWINNGFQ